MEWGKTKLRMVPQACSPGTQKAKAGRLLVRDQPELQEKPYFENKNETGKKKKSKIKDKCMHNGTPLPIGEQGPNALWMLMIRFN